MEKRPPPPAVAGAIAASQIRFSLAGFTLFTSLIILLTAFVAAACLNGFWGLLPARGSSSPTHAAIETRGLPVAPAHAIPPWGELAVEDIQIESPQEYAAEEANNLEPITWQFTGLGREQVTAILASSGLTSEQIFRVLQPNCASFADGNTVIKPGDDLVLALSPAVREKLYLSLAVHDGTNNLAADCPHRLNLPELQKWQQEEEFTPETLDLIKQLSYSRAGVLLFSDTALILRRMPSEEQRLHFVQTLSRQPACMARLCIRPDTDVEKVLGYWARGAQSKDARPLLNAVKRQPGGGTVGLPYLLPPQMRAKVNTFPYPRQLGDAIMNCHWTTMNFFNETRMDDSLANPTNFMATLKQNYYRVSKPSEYGDIVLVLSHNGEPIHSAIFLAEDLLFTKNGQSLQPWIITRLNRLVAQYTYNYPPVLEYYRARGR